MKLGISNTLCCGVILVGLNGLCEDPKPVPAAPPAEGRVLKTDKERLGYALAQVMSQHLKDFKADIDLDQFLADLKDALGGEKPALMSMPDIRNVILNAQRARQAADAAKHGDKERNKKESEEFLAQNGKKEGIITTVSGLQYQIIRAGTGEKPKPEDTVTCNYAGTLVDGTKFDSSYDRGEPAQFPVKGVIAGWTEALQLMPVGSKWKLFIPANLAYGSAGRPGIGPESALIFDIELISIKK